MGNLLKPIYRRLRDKAYTLLPSRRSSEGFKFEGSLHRFKHSPDELGTIIAIKALAPHLTRLVNAGANAGYFCMLADQLGIATIAFEPEAAMFQRLRRNLLRNKCRTVAIPLALSDSSGIAEFFGTGTAGSLLRGLSGTPNYDKQIVPTATADETITPCHGAEIWLMDCEGAEPAIIQGGKNYIAENKPVLIFEYQPERNVSRWHGCLNYLVSAGYTHFSCCSELQSNNLMALKPLTELHKHSGDNILLISSESHQWAINALDQYLDQHSGF